ncbi:MAG: carbohydrate ABC transporter permease [Candidatus Bipolaricaulia bacterium]
MYSRRDRIVAILVLLPSIVLLGVFVYWFIGQNVYFSLTDWGTGAALAKTPQLSFVGLDNYANLFTGFLETRFRQDLVNVFFFTLLFVGGALGLGLLFAIFLDREIHAEGVVRTIFLYPMALSFIVTGTIWRWLFNPSGGLNELPEVFGLSQLQFGWLNSNAQYLQFNWQDLPMVTALVVGIAFALIAVHRWRHASRRAAVSVGIPAVLLLAYYLWGDAITPETFALPFSETHGFNVALIGVVIAAAWQFSGYTMALYLAGMRGVSDDVRESAEIDGCNIVQFYRFVILPLVKPITLSALIILGHISLKTFALVFVMTGPDYPPTDLPSVLMFVKTFRSNLFAEGAAIAVVLFVLVALVVVPYLVSALRERAAT